MLGIDKYIYNDKTMPEWLTRAFQEGKIRESKDENNENILILFDITGKKVVNKGDALVKTNSGIVIVKKDKAKKYLLSEKQKPNYSIKDLREEDDCK